MKKITTWLMVLAGIGICLSLFSFLHNKGFASGSFCSINETFDCDVVNKGPYSEFFGIPVAFIGLVGYALLLTGAILKHKQPEDKALTVFLLLVATGGLGFSLYLTFIEATVLRTWCLICVTSQITMLGYMGLVLRLAYQEEHHKTWMQKIKERIS